MAGSYEDLHVWQKAHAFVLDVYKATSKFPREEQYGITSQIRRAAVSVPTNIVEGKNRNSDRDYGRFLYLSRASCAELEYLLLLARDLCFLSAEDFQTLNAGVRTIGRMINGLIKSIETERPRAVTAGARRLAAGSQTNRRNHKHENQTN